MIKPTSPIGPNDPVSPATDDGGGTRRRRDAKPSTAMVPVGPATTHDREPSPQASPGASAFTAQVMGQTGAKRGLKGGAPVLDAAKAAYLETEWSGPSDRRLAVGKMKKTDV